MKIITPGYRYELASFEGGPPQTIQFLERAAPSGTPSVYEGARELVTINDGTTNEEVLEVLIARIQILNQKAPCRENSIVLEHLETAALWLNKRTGDRKKRGVEGTPAL